MSALDFEIKYTLPVHRASLLRAHLDLVCRRDPDFSLARVHTIYFDTLNLACLGEKHASDYLKTKVRLRWYESLSDGSLSTVFAEIKWRRGARRRKLRQDTGVAGDQLAAMSLTDPALARVPIRALTEAGRRDAVFPVLALSYRRDRFLDAVTGARISLDSEISVVRTHPRFLRRPRPGNLAVAVAEYKSVDADLPPSLRSLVALGARKESFSKYSACFEAAA